MSKKKYKVNLYVAGKVMCTVESFNEDEAYERWLELWMRR